MDELHEDSFPSKKEDKELASFSNRLRRRTTLEKQRARPTSYPPCFTFTPMQHPSFLRGDLMDRKPQKLINPIAEEIANRKGRKVKFADEAGKQLVTFVEIPNKFERFGFRSLTNISSMFDEVIEGTFPEMREAMGENFYTSRHPLPFAFGEDCKENTDLTGCKRKCSTETHLNFPKEKFPRAKVTSVDKTERKNVIKNIPVLQQTKEFASPHQKLRKYSLEEWIITESDEDYGCDISSNDLSQNFSDFPTKKHKDMESRAASSFSSNSHNNGTDILVSNSFSNRLSSCSQNKSLHGQDYNENKTIGECVRLRDCNRKKEMSNLGQTSITVTHHHTRTVPTLFTQLSEETDKKYRELFQKLSSAGQSSSDTEEDNNTSSFGSNKNSQCNRPSDLNTHICITKAVSQKAKDSSNIDIDPKHPGTIPSSEVAKVKVIEVKKLNSPTVADHNLNLNIPENLDHASEEVSYTIKIGQTRRPVIDEDKCSQITNSLSSNNVDYTFTYCPNTSPGSQFSSSGQNEDGNKDVMVSSFQENPNISFTIPIPAPSVDSSDECKTSAVFTCNLAQFSNGSLTSSTDSMDNSLSSCELLLTTDATSTISNPERLKDDFISTMDSTIKDILKVFEGVNFPEKNDNQIKLFDQSDVKQTMSEKCVGCEESYFDGVNNILLQTDICSRSKTAQNESSLHDDMLNASSVLADEHDMSNFTSDKKISTDDVEHTTAIVQNCRDSKCTDEGYSRHELEHDTSTQATSVHEFESNKNGSESGTNIIKKSSDKDGKVVQIRDQSSEQIRNESIMDDKERLFYLQQNQLANKHCENILATEIVDSDPETRPNMEQSKDTVMEDLNIESDINYISESAESCSDTTNSELDIEEIDRERNLENNGTKAEPLPEHLHDDWMKPPECYLNVIHQPTFRHPSEMSDQVSIYQESESGYGTHSFLSEEIPQEDSFSDEASSSGGEKVSDGKENIDGQGVNSDIFKDQSLSDRCHEDREILEGLSVSSDDDSVFEGIQEGEEFSFDLCIRENGDKDISVCDNAVMSNYNTASHIATNIDVTGLSDDYKLVSEENLNNPQDDKITSQICTSELESYTSPLNEPFSSSINISDHSQIKCNNVQNYSCLLSSNNQFNASDSLKYTGIEKGENKSLLLDVVKPKLQFQEDVESSDVEVYMPRNMCKRLVDCMFRKKGYQASTDSDSNEQLRDRRKLYMRPRRLRSSQSDRVSPYKDKEKSPHEGAFKHFPSGVDDMDKFPPKKRKKSVEIKTSSVTNTSHQASCDNKSDESSSSSTDDDDTNFGDESDVDSSSKDDDYDDSDHCLHISDDMTSDDIDNKDYKQHDKNKEDNINVIKNHNICDKRTSLEKSSAASYRSGIVCGKSFSQGKDCDSSQFSSQSNCDIQWHKKQKVSIGDGLEIADPIDTNTKSSYSNSLFTEETNSASSISSSSNQSSSVSSHSFSEQANSVGTHSGSKGSQCTHTTMANSISMASVNTDSNSVSTTSATTNLDMNSSSVDDEHHKCFPLSKIESTNELTKIKIDDSSVVHGSILSGTSSGGNSKEGSNSQNCEPDATRGHREDSQHFSFDNETNQEVSKHNTSGNLESEENDKSITSTFSKPENGNKVDNMCDNKSGKSSLSDVSSFCRCNHLETSDSDSNATSHYSSDKKIGIKESDLAKAFASSDSVSIKSSNYSSSSDSDKGYCYDLCKQYITSNSSDMLSSNSSTCDNSYSSYDTTDSHFDSISDSKGSVLVHNSETSSSNDSNNNSNSTGSEYITGNDSINGNSESNSETTTHNGAENSSRSTSNDNNYGHTVESKLLSRSSLGSENEPDTKMKLSNTSTTDINEDKYLAQEKLSDVSDSENDSKHMEQEKLSNCSRTNSESEHEARSKSSITSSIDSQCEYLTHKKLCIDSESEQEANKKSSTSSSTEGEKKQRSSVTSKSLLRTGSKTEHKTKGKPAISSSTDSESEHVIQGKSSHSTGIESDIEHVMNMHGKSSNSFDTDSENEHVLQEKSSNSCGTDSKSHHVIQEKSSNSSGIDNESDHVIQEKSSNSSGTDSEIDHVIQEKSSNGSDTNSEHEHVIQGKSSNSSDTNSEHEHVIHETLSNSSRTGSETEESSNGSSSECEDDHGIHEKASVSCSNSDISTNDMYSSSSSVKSLDHNSKNSVSENIKREQDACHLESSLDSLSGMESKLCDVNQSISDVDINVSVTITCDGKLIVEET